MKISDVRVAHKERGHDRPVRDALQTLAGGGSTEVTILADSAAEGHGVISFGRIDGAPRALAVLVEEVVRPVLVGRDATNITGLLEDLKREMEYFGLSGLTRFAIAAVDTALWDLYGKLRGEPCYLLWGAQRDRLPAYAMVGAASFGVPYASHGGGPAALSVLLCAPSAIWLEAGISEGGSGFPVIEDGCALAPRGPGFEWQ